MENNSIENLIERLTSNDANDRVKAAADLGEVGTVNEAPHLLKAVYEDEASTVRQIAIQAYAEILKRESFPEVKKAALSHFDEYVQFYAITVLGSYPGKDTEDVLTQFLTHESEKLRAVAIRSMIHIDAKSLSDTLFDHLKSEENGLITRNIIEALTLWRYKNALPYIKELFETTNDIELKTIISFYGASFGEKKLLNYLQNEHIDDFLRVNIKNQTFRGRTGLLEALKLL